MNGCGLKPLKLKQAWAGMISETAKEVKRKSTSVASRFIPLDLPWFASMQLVLFIGLALTVQVLREASKVEKKSQTSVDTLG